MTLMTLLGSSKKIQIPAVAVQFEENELTELCSDPCAERLLRLGQYCKLLKSPPDTWEVDATSAASKTLENKMAFVPSGATTIEPIVSCVQNVETNPPLDVSSDEDAFFVDRFAVTNADFEHFVKASGYRQEEYWPEEILPLVFQFVDLSNQAGPVSWKHGSPPASKREHPVTGVSWYEANAYAIWAGKQLPTSTQWQRAGTWWKPNVRYPWGNGFEVGRANTGQSTETTTAPVNVYGNGSTPNGIHQLVGNVWEWVHASINEVEIDTRQVPVSECLGEVRGGAFNTYLPSQSTCLYRSGRPLLSRNENVGFRCCVNIADMQSLRPPNEENVE